ncbi:hypothetical protein [Pyrococcus kukulkanii]|uniref:hypothetical protein n=1 Tax=Pyrococcus kukulkanii TaxID=1609559 RepID=UPI003563A636
MGVLGGGEVIGGFNFFVGAVRRGWLKIRRKFKEVRRFLLYEFGSFAYALVLTVHFWIAMEGSLIVMTVFLSLVFGIREESKMLLLYALLHSLVLLMGAWFYILIGEGLRSMESKLASRGVRYTLHSPYWHDLFLAVFSSVVSLYLVALFIAIMYVVFPEKLRNTIYVPQATLYLGLASYIPFIFEFQKIAKVNLYQKRSKRLRDISLSWTIQQNN